VSLCADAEFRPLLSRVSARRLEGPLYIANSVAPIEPARLDEQLIALTENPIPVARLGAVEELARLLRSRDPGVVLAARQTLEEMVDDDSRRVASRVEMVLEEFTAERAPPEVEEKRREAEEETRRKAEARRRREAEERARREAEARRRREAEEQKRREAEEEAAREVEARKRREAEERARRTPWRTPRAVAMVLAVGTVGDLVVYQTPRGGDAHCEPRRSIPRGAAHTGGARLGSQGRAD
jgi:hypothetical protein